MLKESCVEGGALLLKDAALLKSEHISVYYNHQVTGTRLLFAHTDSVWGYGKSNHFAFIKAEL